MGDIHAQPVPEGAANGNGKGLVSHANLSYDKDEVGKTKILE